MIDRDLLSREQNCYLTTTGRVTGKPHTIEIWFALREDAPTFYMLAGGGYNSDWVRNIRKDPAVAVRIAGRTFAGRARILGGADEALLARRLVVKKYYGRDELRNAGWEAEALPVAVDLDV